MEPIKRKEIVFSKTINDESIKWLFEECSKDTHIMLFLNSYGGDPSAAHAFVEYVKYKKIDLHVHVLNNCASAAITLLLAAKKRTAGLNAMFLLHPVKKTFKEYSVNEEELNSQAKDIERLNKMYYVLISKKTKKPIKQIVKICRQEKLFNSEEAFKLGLLTEKPR